MAAVAELWRSGEELCAAAVWLGEEAENSKAPFSQGFLWFWSQERGRAASSCVFVWGSPLLQGRWRAALKWPASGEKSRGRGGLLFPGSLLAKGREGWLAAECGRVCGLEWQL